MRNIVIMHQLLHSLQHSVLAAQAGKQRSNRHALLMQAAKAFLQRQRLHKLRQLFGIIADAGLRLRVFDKSIKLLPQRRCIS